MQKFMAELTSSPSPVSISNQQPKKSVQNLLLQGQELGKVGIRADQGGSVRKKGGGRI